MARNMGAHTQTCETTKIHMFRHTTTHADIDFIAYTDVHTEAHAYIQIDRGAHICTHSGTHRLEYIQRNLQACTFRDNIHIHTEGHTHSHIYRHENTQRHACIPGTCTYTHRRTYRRMRKEAHSHINTLISICGVHAKSVRHTRACIYEIHTVTYLP